jgi:hypothetical protein
MSRKKRNCEDKIRGQFVPLRFETLRSPAYKQLTFGARALYAAILMRCFRNNGGVYLSQREAQKELGRGSRNDIANWFRELQHYGFIAMTAAASLGVNGKGKAPHFRITDKPTRDKERNLVSATDDFAHWDGEVFVPHVAPSNRWNGRKQALAKKQNPGLGTESTVDSVPSPLVDSTREPPEEGIGSYVESIRLH